MSPVIFLSGSRLNIWKVASGLSVRSSRFWVRALKLSYKRECSHQSVTNIFEYSNIRIYWSRIYIRTFVFINFSFTNIFGHSLVSVLECKTLMNIRIYSNIRAIFNTNTCSDIRSCQIWIYSDIHSCHFVDTNIFGHSFVSKFSRMSHSDVDCPRYT